jgi:peptidyl-prolyl cis-trans isomerase C
MLLVKTPRVFWPNNRAHVEAFGLDALAKSRKGEVVMQSKVKRLFWALPFALTLVWVASTTWTEEKQPSGSKASVVNGVVITQEEFDIEMSRVQRMLLSRGTQLSGSRLSGVKKEVLESLINRELLYQESQRKGIEIDETAVDERLSTLKKRFSSEAEFKSALSQMNLSEATVKSQIGREIAIEQLIDEQFADKVSVSAKETKTYYDDHPDFFKQPEQVRASHILIKVDPKANETRKTEARKEIEKIQEKLRQGEDFAALAKEFSQGPTSVRGGDLNYFRRGQMAKPFEDVAFGLKPGEVSDIVETKFGYHLIKVTDKKPEGTIAYEDVKEKIGGFLNRQKTQEETRGYAQKLKEKADVKRFLEVEP